jgi:hypothetical protein
MATESQITDNPGLESEIIACVRYRSDIDRRVVSAE